MKLKVREIVVFAMLGAVMYVSKLLMEALPNVHLLGAFVIALTVVYRKKALYPIYIYVFLNGLFAGFSTWWVPYLYIWTVLWGAAMLLPKKLPDAWRPLIYAALCGLHGFLFGILYAPAQALFFGLDWEGTLAWIAAGLSADLIHGIGNFVFGFLICPLIAALKNAEKYGK